MMELLIYRNWQMYEELAWTYKFGTERPVFKPMMNERQIAAYLAFGKI